MLSIYKTFYAKNKATITGIVTIESNVVIKTALAAKATSFWYSVANNTAIFPTGIASIIKETPSIKGSRIKAFKIG